MRAPNAAKYERRYAPEVVADLTVLGEPVIEVLAVGERADQIVYRTTFALPQRAPARRSRPRRPAVPALPAQAQQLGKRAVRLG